MSLDRGCVKNSFLHFDDQDAEDLTTEFIIRRSVSCPGDKNFMDESFSTAATCLNAQEELLSDDACSIMTQEEVFYAPPYMSDLSPTRWADLADDDDDDDGTTSTIVMDNLTVKTMSTTDMGSLQSPDTVSSRPETLERMALVRSYSYSDSLQSEVARTPQHFEAGNPRYRQVRLSGNKSRPAQTVFMSETPWSEVLPVRKRNTASELERLGRPQRLQRQKDTRNNLPRFLCTFFVGIEDDAEFTVAKRIIGPQGRNMKYIAEESQGSKIRLRGKGSMFTERETGYESFEPLQINVSVVNRSGYKRAKELVARLLEDIYGEYYKVYGIKVYLDLLEDPRNPAS